MHIEWGINIHTSRSQVNGQMAQSRQLLNHSAILVMGQTVQYTHTHTLL